MAFTVTAPVGDPSGRDGKAWGGGEEEEFTNNHNTKVKSGGVVVNSIQTEVR
jgi:hypothetical protein